MTSNLSFEVSFDYRCPFAWIAHEHVVAALRTDPGWQVTFTPWTLLQVHKEESDPDVWDNPDRRDDLLALEASLAVRDGWPDRFLDAHIALFRARHEQGLRLVTRDEVRGVLDSVEIDTDKVLAVVDEGGPRVQVAESWRRLTTDHAAFGVPTFIVGDQAAFVRVMTRPSSPDEARTTVEGLVTMVAERQDINEFKRTRIER